MVNILHLKGTNYEIGYKHGVLAKSQISACLKAYGTYFASVGMSPGDVARLAEDFRQSIKEKVPHLYEEIKGIAEGADVSVLDIVALNARSEIALAAKPIDNSSHTPIDGTTVPIPPDGCTTFAETLSNGKQWLAQNWDWQTSQLGNLVLLEIDLPENSGAEAKKLKTMTEAGLLAKLGFNSEHVGVCLNALRATDIDTTKLPLHVLLRLILESKSAESALERIQTRFGNGSACYGHFGVADGSGRAMSWEIGPYGVAIIEKDEKGRLYHTNHILKEGQKATEIVWLDDTQSRVARLKDLVSISDSRNARTEDLSDEEQKDRIFSFLKDEDNYPNSICRDNDASQSGLLGQLQTVFSIVMDLTDAHAWVSVGRPKRVLEEFELAF
ncbi:acyl-coenzyme A:6-aminopenicillanic acid acyl-transferase-domain-containing protein [Dipodascopsis uninucleata]